MDRSSSTSVSDHPSETSYADAAQTTGPNTELIARRAVAHAVMHVRRWDEAGILAAFDAATKRGYDFAAVAAGLFDIAMDASAKTPGVLVTRLANGWRRSPDIPTPSPKLERCQRCHLRHAEGTPCGNPKPSTAGLAEARQALADIRISGVLCVHGVPRPNCLQHPAGPPVDTREEHR